MASTGQPLGIGLGIDFSRLDSDLQKVADRIENVGKTTSLKIGTLGGMAGKDDTAKQMGDQLATVGMSLSKSIASGIRTSDALLLSFGARINAMLDSIAKVLATALSRIDAAIKGTRWTNLFTSLAISLGNFAAGAAKGLTPLEKALGGAFGKTAKLIASVFDTMFKELAAKMEQAMDAAAEKMAASMTKASRGMVSAFQGPVERLEISVQSLANTMRNSMVKAIDEIAKKMKDLRGVGEAAAEGLAGIGAPRPYIRELSPPKRKAPIVDVEANIKPPSQAAIDRFAKGISKLHPDVLGEFLKEPKSLPKPQMFQALKSVINDTVQGIKNIPPAMQAAVAAGNPYAQTAMMIGKAFQKADQMATGLFNGIVRIGAGLAAMGFAAAAAIGKQITFFSTLGSVGKVTYGSLFRDNNIFVASVAASVKTVYHLVRGMIDLVTLGAFRRATDDVKKFKSGLQTSLGLVGNLIGSVARFGSELSAALGAVGLVFKLVQFFKQGVAGAADLNVTVAKTKSTFGDSFGMIEEQANKTSKEFGVMRNQQLKIADGFGVMAQGAGMTEEASAQLASTMTKLTLDFAAREQMPVEQAAEMLQTGLAGQGRELKKHGAFIDENITKNRAMAMGMREVGGALTKQQTIVANASILTSQLSYAEGALAATSSGAAGQFKRAGGGISEFATRVGEMLMPAVQAGTTGLNSLLAGSLDLLERGGPTITSWSEAAASNIETLIATTKEFGPSVVSNLSWAWDEAKKGPLGFVIKGAEAIWNFAKAIPEAIGVGIRNMGTLWEIAKIQTGVFVDNAIATLRTLPENLPRLWEWLKRNWMNLLTDMLSMASHFASNLMENMANLGKAIWDALKTGEFDFSWKPLLDGFEATTEALPELIKPALVSAEDQVAKLWEKLGQDELNRAKKAKKDQATFGSPPGEIDEGKDKDKEYKLGGALEEGSKEAFSAISRGLTGKNSTTDAVKEGVSVSRDIHKAITQQTEVIKNKPKENDFDKK